MTGSPQVHGMGRELVAPDWPPLTEPEVDALLRRYGLGTRQILWRSPRPLSTAALVQTDQGAVFVKRHAAVVRAVEGLTEEHAFADHLRARGIPVPEVLADRDGRRAVALGPWTWEVHAAGRGDDTYRDVPSWEPCVHLSHAVAVGSVLAQIADAARDFDAPARQPQLLVSSWAALSSEHLVPALEGFVADRPMLAGALAGRDWRADVEQLLVPLHDLLVPHLPELTSAWTHGDGHASNFLWGGPAVTAVLDLGLSDRTTPLLDLATAVERHAVSWLDPEPKVRPGVAEALLEGWSSVRPLTVSDTAALGALLPLVHVEFALSELAYFAAVTRSAGNERRAYDGYLLGHARWFDSADGRALRRQLAEPRS